MHHKIVLSVVLFVGLNLPAIAEDPTVDRLLASQCAQCHGTNGYAVGEMDKLAGQEEKDLIEDLRDMRREDRAENIMDHQALGYTEAQIRLIARYYNTLPEEINKNQEDQENKQDKDSEKR